MGCQGEPGSPAAMQAEGPLGAQARCLRSRGGRRARLCNANLRCVNVSGFTQAGRRRPPSLWTTWTVESETFCFFPRRFYCPGSRLTGARAGACVLSPRATAKKIPLSSALASQIEKPAYAIRNNDQKTRVSIVLLLPASIALREASKHVRCQNSDDSSPTVSAGWGLIWNRVSREIYHAREQAFRRRSD
jgi:hypothetical protein